MQKHFTELLCFEIGKLFEKGICVVDQRPQTVEMAPCPRCAHDTTHIIIADHAESEDAPFGNYFSSTFQIIKCGGCGHVHFRQEFVDSGEFELDTDNDGNDVIVDRPVVSIWPPIGPFRPENWKNELIACDPHIFSLYCEIYSAANNESFALCSMGLRAIYERATFRLADNKDIRKFADKLAFLKDNHFITGQQELALEALVEAGHAAIHRFWIPDEDEIAALLDILNDFLYRNFISHLRSSRAAMKLRTNIPKALR